jgi:hypothetical protein
MALGESMVVGLGLSWTPGDATIGKADDFNDAADITLEASEFITYYIQPMIAVNEHSAIFFKYGESEADLKVTGDFTGAASNDLSGTTTSVGTVSKFASGMYMQVEAGLTEYDTISVKDIGNAGNNGSKGDAEASPEVAYGTVTIGYNFVFECLLKVITYSNSTISYFRRCFCITFRAIVTSVTNIFYRYSIVLS